MVVLSVACTLLTSSPVHAAPSTGGSEEQLTAPLPQAGRTAPPPKAARQAATSDTGGLGDLGLRRQRDGGYLYVDPSKRFSATFRPNGTVEFAERLRRPSRQNPGKGTCCALPPGGLPGINPLLGMQMRGPAEWILAAQKKETAATDKRELLERTSELRVALAVSWNVELLKHRFVALEAELLDIWSDQRRTRVARKELLFQLWDDCDETFALDPGDIPMQALGIIDAARADTAVRARRLIEAFLRRHAPGGSPSMFTAQELDDMNRRRTSRERFDPYRSSSRDETDP